MGRQSHIRHRFLPWKGVNQQIEKSSLLECADALNVWARNGRIEQRPGFIPVTSIGTRFEIAVSSGNLDTAKTEDVSASTFTTLPDEDYNTNDTEVGDRWYLGFNAAEVAGITGSSAPSYRLDVKSSDINTAATDWKAMYYDGTKWRYLPLVIFNNFSVSDATSRDVMSKFGENTIQQIIFARPHGWSTITIDGLSAFWIRVELLNANMSSATVRGDGNDQPQAQKAANENTPGAPILRFPRTKRYILMAAGGAGANKNTLVYSSVSSLKYDNLVDLVFTSPESLVELREPPVAAVVSQFEEAFISYDYTISRHKAYPTEDDTLDADVETADFAVGPGAPYDPEFIPQLALFPAAKYLTFFKGRLWASNILGETQTVRWSAPAPFYKVWPTLSAEPLIEADDSPITGQHPLGENLIVFKDDSIWQMVPTGQNEFGLDTFSPVKAQSGVGCVSHHSIKEVRGRLIFLAEDGVYAFDGTPTIIKLSDRIQNTIDSIVPSRRPFSVGVNWKTRSVYLLAISVNGSLSNNRVLVWDYKNDSWWIWDNIDADTWMLDEDEYSNERLYYKDGDGNIYELGVGNDDSGKAISSHFTSQRPGYKDNFSMTVRSVELTLSNETGSPTVEVIANDDTGNSSSGSIVVTDNNEAKFNTAVFNTDTFTTSKRRARRIGFRKLCDWYQIKVSHSTQGRPFQCSMIDVATIPKGTR